jgi:integrase
MGVPKRPKFLPIERPEGFMVSVPAAMSGNGRRQRKFFEKKPDAEKFAAKLRTRYHEGERSGVISHALALDAAAAAALLAPHGLSLLDAAKDVAKRLEAEGNSETFQERLSRVLPLGEMHWSDRYARDMGKLDRQLPKSFMRMRCAVITPEIIRRALVDGGSHALSTIENRARYVSAILSYKPRHRASGEIAIMAPEQVVKFFAACLDDVERRACGLLLYAGIRPSVNEGEITRLDWEDVGKDSIFVSVEVSKTNTERIIPMTPALRRAIKGHPKSGLVIPPDWKRRIAKIRTAAGVKGEQDITRHTFASHFLAAYGEDATKEAMGHTAGSRTLFKHYRRAVTQEDGKVFFK